MQTFEEFVTQYETNPEIYFSKFEEFLEEKNYEICNFLCEQKDLSKIIESLFWKNCRLGNLTTVKFLLEKGSKTMISANRDYAFIKAVKSQNLELIRFLLENGACPISRNNYAFVYSIDQSIKDDNLEIVKLLLEKGAEINASRGYALQKAAEAGCQEIVNFLLQNGADANIDGCYALQKAAEKGFFQIVKDIFMRGVDVEKVHESLVLAFRNGRTKIIRFFLDQHIDINKCGDQKLIEAFNSGNFGEKVYNTSPFNIGLSDFKKIYFLYKNECLANFENYFIYGNYEVCRFLCDQKDFSETLSKLGIDEGFFYSH